ncbi:MAG: hypothetical protein QOE24_2699, partial [Frankiales bacterium]|nr:hypothetical protein [Frankiales bacterium]
MSTRRGGLGRGLGALIPTSAPASVADLSVHADSRQAAADTG